MTTPTDTPSNVLSLADARARRAAATPAADTTPTPRATVNLAAQADANAANAARVAADRARQNDAVKRSYRLRPPTGGRP